MNYYCGLDIGGTKIAGALVTPAGKIINRIKIATPRKVKAKVIYDCIIDTIEQLLSTSSVAKKNCKGIGLGVPGIVDTLHNHILAAPNIDLTGFPLAVQLRRRFKTKIKMTNDVNAGLLGEAWLGSARGLQHVVGIFPGTGVGGAVINDGKLILGKQGAATELGHMIVDINGPLCHCGNYGCLESLASRWAIERDIHALIKSGRRSIITKLNNGTTDQIKSRILKEALEKHDPVVCAVMLKVANILGKSSVSLNHIFNPQAIIFGGGVIKACGPFILPIIVAHLKKDPFFKAFNSCQILQSALGDDAVMLGAVQLCLSHK